MAKGRKGIEGEYRIPVKSCTDPKHEQVKNKPHMHTIIIGEEGQGNESR